MTFAGGFQGRTNKLVDSCYSFWMGAIFPQLTGFISSQSRTEGNEKDKDKDKESKGEEGYSAITAEELAQGIHMLNPGDTNIDAPKIVEIQDDDSVADYEKEENENIGFWLYDQRALQNYVLF